MTKTSHLYVKGLGGFRKYTQNRDITSYLPGGQTRRINSDTKRMSWFTRTLLHTSTLQFTSNSQMGSQRGRSEKTKRQKNISDVCLCVFLYRIVISIAPWELHLATKIPETDKSYYFYSHGRWSLKDQRHRLDMNMWEFPTHRPTNKITTNCAHLQRT